MHVRDRRDNDTQGPGVFEDAFALTLMLGHFRQFRVQKPVGNHVSDCPIAARVREQVTMNYFISNLCCPPNSNFLACSSVVDPSGL